MSSAPEMSQDNQMMLQVLMKLQESFESWKSDVSLKIDNIQKVIDFTQDVHSNKLLRTDVILNTSSGEEGAGGKLNTAFRKSSIACSSGGNQPDFPESRAIAYRKESDMMDEKWKASQPADVLPKMNDLEKCLKLLNVYVPELVGLR